MREKDKDHEGVPARKEKKMGLCLLAAAFILMLCGAVHAEPKDTPPAPAHVFEMDQDGNVLCDYWMPPQPGKAVGKDDFGRGYRIDAGDRFAVVFKGSTTQRLHWKVAKTDDLLRVRKASMIADLGEQRLQSFSGSVTKDTAKAFAPRKLTPDQERQLQGVLVIKNHAIETIGIGSNVEFVRADGKKAVLCLYVPKPATPLCDCNDCPCPICDCGTAPKAVSCPGGKCQVGCCQPACGPCDKHRFRRCEHQPVRHFLSRFRVRCR